MAAGRLLGVHSTTVQPAPPVLRETCLSREQLHEPRIGYATGGQPDADHARVDGHNRVVLLGCEVSAAASSCQARSVSATDHACAMHPRGANGESPSKISATDPSP